MGAPSEREQAIERTLLASMPDVVAEAGVRARRVDDWLELMTSENRRVPLAMSEAWSALRCNAVLRGAVRMALAPGAADIHLRGELFIEDDAQLNTRVNALCEDVRAAFHSLRDATHRRWLGTAAEPADVARMPRDEGRLVHLCAEAGWACTDTSGRVEMAIDCGPAQYQAHLELTEAGGLSAVADLGDAVALTPASRAATAWLLLRASAVVRSVKGVVVRRDGVEHAGMATACEPLRSAADLGRALAALTVACGLVGRETEALRHEALAHEYLAWCAPARLDDQDSMLESNQDDHDNQYEMEERPCLQQL